MCKPSAGFAVLVVAALLSFGCSLQPVAADVEPNNVRHRAEEISPGTHEGHVGAEDDERDWYTFAVTGGDIVRVTMHSVEGGDDVEMRLRNHEGSGLEGLDPMDDPQVTYFTRAELNQCMWYLQVDDEGPYRFILEIMHQNDGGKGADAPKDPREGPVVQTGLIRGMMQDDDEHDSYRFLVKPKQRIEAEFIADFERFEERMNWLELQVRDGDGSLREGMRSAGQPEKCRVGPLEIEEPQLWSLTVSGEGDYWALLRIIDIDGQEIEPQHRDMAIAEWIMEPRYGELRQPPSADVEPNDYRHRASRIGPGTYEGIVGADDDEREYYAFDVAGGEVIHITMHPVEGGSDVEIGLEDHMGSGFGSMDPVDDRELVRLTPAELPDRLYYLCVTEEGPYRFTLDIEQQDDAGKGVDAPKEREHGLLIGPGDIHGMLQDNDEWDSYRFGVAPGQTIDVEFAADFERFEEEMNWVELQLRDGDGGLQEGLRSVGQPVTCRVGPLEIDEPQLWSLTAGTEGDYDIQLRITGVDGRQVISPMAIGRLVKPVEGPRPLDTEVLADLQPVERAPIEIAPQGAAAGELEVSDEPLFVRVALDSLYCVDESDVDRGTDSDEPYLIVTGYATHLEPAAWSTGEPKVFGDVDRHENRRMPARQWIAFEGEVPSGGCVGFSVLAMESDDWPRETRQQLAEHMAEKTALAVTGAAEAATAEAPDTQNMWEIAADATKDFLGSILSAPLRFLLGFFESIVGGEDDRITDATVALHHDQLAQWAAQGTVHAMPRLDLHGGDEGHYKLRWHVEFDQDATTSFEARFTHYDDMAIGNVVGGSELEIVTACDNDASGDDGRFRIYRADGTSQGVFDCFYTKYDHIAIGDVRGGGPDEIIVASDDHDGMVNIYTGTGNQLYSFPAPYTKYDGLAVGDVTGGPEAEILIARDDSNEVFIYDDQGEQVGGFGLHWRFDGTRCTGSATRNDVFLVGDVIGDERDEIVMIQKRNLDSPVFVYDAAGHQQNVALDTVFLTNRDGFVLADIRGDAKKELLIATDKGDGSMGCCTRVYDFAAGQRVDPRYWPVFTKNDGFAAGDVLGTGRDQIVVATDEDDRMYISK